MACAFLRPSPCACDAHAGERLRWGLRGRGCRRQADPALSRHERDRHPRQPASRIRASRAGPTRKRWCFIRHGARAGRKSQGRQQDVGRQSDATKSADKTSDATKSDDKKSDDAKSAGKPSDDKKSDDTKPDTNKLSYIFGKNSKKKENADWTCSASLVFEDGKLMRVTFAHKGVHSPYDWQAEKDPVKQEEKRKEGVPTCEFSLPKCAR
jgi:hypothetical protein